MIFWVQQNDREPMTFVAEVSDDLADALVTSIKETAALPSGGRSKPVEVVAIDDEKFSQYEKPRGNAAPLHVGQVFPSAMAISLALGYPARNNAVKQALSDDRVARNLAAGKGHTHRIRPRGELRGVVFMLQEDVPETFETEWLTGRFEKRASMTDD